MTPNTISVNEDIEFAYHEPRSFKVCKAVRQTSKLKGKLGPASLCVRLDLKKVKVGTKSSQLQL